MVKSKYSLNLIDIFRKAKTLKVLLVDGLFKYKSPDETELLVCPDLETVHFDNWNEIRTDDFARDLAFSLPNLHSLIVYTEEPSSFLMFIQLTSENLKNLHLQCHQMNDGVATELKKANFQNLEQLKLRGNMKDISQLKSLLNIFKNNSKLTKLEITSFEVPDNEQSSISLEDFPLLKTLVIGVNLFCHLRQGQLLNVEELMIKGGIGENCPYEQFENAVAKIEFPALTSFNIAELHGPPLASSLLKQIDLQAPKMRKLFLRQQLAPELTVGITNRTIFKNLLVCKDSYVCGKTATLFATDQGTYKYLCEMKTTRENVVLKTIE
jgi:hypothetical protein